MIAVKPLIDRTHDGAFAVDFSLTIVAWNRSATEILGIPEADALGRPCYQVIAGRDGRGHEVCRRGCSPLRCAVAGGLPPHYELRARVENGSPIWLDVSIISLPGARRSDGLLVHVFRPIARAKQLETFVQSLADEARRLGAAPPDVPPRETAALASLSPRERDVLRLLRHGHDTSSIAKALRISAATVRTHIQHVLDKLGVHTKMAAALVAARHGLD